MASSPAESVAGARAASADACADRCERGFELRQARLEVVGQGRFGGPGGTKGSQLFAQGGELRAELVERRRRLRHARRRRDQRGGRRRRERDAEREPRERADAREPREHRPAHEPAEEARLLRRCLDLLPRRSSAITTPHRPPAASPGDGAHHRPGLRARLEGCTPTAAVAGGPARPRRPRRGRFASMAEMEWIPGRATPQGTRRFAARFPELPGHFRCPDRLSVSSFGLGTRSGEIGGVDDLLYRQAVPELLAGGVNLFDTALSDRMQTSERALGVSLARAIREGAAARDEIVVVTKGGLLTPDPELARSAGEARRNLVASYLDTGLVPPERLVGGVLCLEPAFLRDQILRSRRNLRLETLDVWLIEQPELALQAFGGAGVPASPVSRLRSPRSSRLARARSQPMASCSWDGLPALAHRSRPSVAARSLPVGAGRGRRRSSSARDPAPVQPGDGRGAAAALADRPLRRHRGRCSRRCAAPEPSCSRARR